MKTALAILAVLTVLGCGASRGNPTSPQSFELLLNPAFGDQIWGFQVSVLADARSLDCSLVQATCLNMLDPLPRILSTTDSEGNRHKGVLFPISAELSDGGPMVQTVLMSGIPVGQDYAVVIEALSRDNPPKFLGSSCNYVQKIEPGTNSPLIARKIELRDPPVDCDPRFEQ